MSANNDAGKILITPKGEYNGSTTYEILDAVYYITSTVKGVYIAKTTTTGNLPTDTTKWNLLIDLSTFIINSSVATSSAVGLVKPDGITDEVDALGVLTALGVVIKAEIDTNVTAHGSTWLKVGSTTLTPNTKQVYRVTENNREYLYYWNGTNYVKVTTEHIIVNAAGTEFAQRSKLKVTGASVVDDAQNDQTLLNFSGGGGGGSTIKVTTSESTLRGKNVTITDGTTTLTEAFNNLGVTIFEGVTLTGNLTISSSDGVETATRSISVPYFGNYETSLAFWAATINVTVSSSSLNGQTVYAKKNGVVKGYATIVNGAASITVPEAGTYSIEATLQWMTYTASVVVSAETTYSATLTTFSATINLTTPTAEFRSQSIAVTVDGASIAGTAFDNNGEATYTALKAGTYVFTLSYGGETYTATQVVTTETTYSVQIKMWTATIVCSTSSAALIGETLTVKKSGATVGTTTFDNNGDATYSVHETGTYTLEAVDSGWTYSTEVAVSEETTYTATLNTFDATLSFSTTATELSSATITIKKGGVTVGTATFSSGSASYVVHETGTYTCECTYQSETYSSSVTVSAQTTYNVSIEMSKTMSVILDLSNDDPTSWATYADDAVGMTAGSADWDEFFGHYPCILDNGTELGNLKKSDFSKYDDNSAAPITTLGKDVMIAYPRRGIKFEYLSATSLKISMTTKNNETGYSYKAHTYKGSACDKFYLAAYKGKVDSGNLYSVSGQTPTASMTIGDFRTAARARGTGYEQSAYYQLIFRQVMYALKYKCQNAQIAIGRGFVDGNSAIYGNTGYTNDKGMDWGESTGKYPMKLFGLEDFYGNIYEFIDGIFSNSNRQLLASDGGYNDTGTGYETVSSATASSNWSGYMRYPVGNNGAGFAPLVSNADKGSETTYFCDYATVNAGRLGGFGGKWNDVGDAGVFRLSVGRAASSADAYYGARLMYMHTS